MRGYLKIFFIPYVLFWVLGFGVYLSHEHGDFVVWLNQQNGPFLDVLFKYGTYLGDGVFLAIVALVMLFLKRRHGYVLIILGVLQAIVSWILKRQVFGKTPRPKKFFEDFSNFHMVEGVDLNSWFSFPSGHTMTAFSIATFLTLTFKNPRLSLLFLLMALVAGLSRIYLLQHFLIDVLVGSCVGIILALAIHLSFKRYLEPSS